MKTTLFCIAILLCASFVAFADLNLTFDSNPLTAPGTSVVGPNSSIDVTLMPSQAFEYETAGMLKHNVCSNWRVDESYVPDTSQFVADGSRVEFALGKTYTQADSFSFGAVLRVNTMLLATGGFQMGFGLVNSVTTGFDRVSAGDTYDTIEFNYFPRGEWGATAQGLFFGSQNGAFSSWERLESTFNVKLPPADDPVYGFPNGLPEEVWMKVDMSYDAATRTLTLQITDPVTGDPIVPFANTPGATLPSTWSYYDFGTGQMVDTGVPATFAVDSLAIFNYQDAWASGLPSLLADVDYASMWFTEMETQSGSSVVPEPAGMVLVAIGAAGFLVRRRSA